MNFKLGFVLLTIILLGSCKTPKGVTYLQNIDSYNKEQMEQMAQSYSVNICEDDLLTITVTSRDPSVVLPFNPPPFAYAVQGETTVSTAQQLQTYLVDKEGKINFPVLGRLQASGLSKQELSDRIQQGIAKYVSDAMVNIQIVNFKVTMVGEVARPGGLYVRNDRLSILEAIGQAGDLTINANRKNILVIRDRNGVKEHGRVDITDPAVFASPYFYLQQNDWVYVEPNDAKKRNANYSSSQQFNVTIFSAVISALSLITSVVITLTK